MTQLLKDTTVVKLSEEESYEVDDVKIAELIGPFSYLGFYYLSGWDKVLFSEEVCEKIKAFNYVTDAKIKKEINRIFIFMKKNNLHEESLIVNINQVKNVWIDLKKSLACCYIISFLHEDLIYEMKTNWILMEIFKLTADDLINIDVLTKENIIDNINYLYTGPVHDMLSVTSEVYLNKNYVSKDIKNLINLFSVYRPIFEMCHFFEEKTLKERLTSWFTNLLKLKKI